MTLKIRVDSAGPPARGARSGDGGFDLSLNPVFRQTSDTSGQDEVLYGSLVRQRETGPSGFNEGAVNLDALQVPTTETVAEVKNVDTDIADYDPVTGILTHKTDGRCRVTASANGVRKASSVQIEQVTIDENLTPFRTLPGTYAEASLTASYPLIANIPHSLTELIPTPEEFNLFSEYDPTTRTFVRNPNYFYQPFVNQLLGWCTDTANKDFRTVTAITPRHAVGVSHYNYTPPAGTVVSWTLANGTVITRTVLGTGYPEGFVPPVTYGTYADGTRGDLAVAVLDQDLPMELVTPIASLESTAKFTRSGALGGWDKDSVNSLTNPACLMCMRHFRNTQIAAIASYGPTVLPEDPGEVHFLLGDVVDWETAKTKYPNLTFGNQFTLTKNGHTYEYDFFNAIWGLKSLWGKQLGLHRVISSGDSGSPFYMITPNLNLVLVGCMARGSSVGLAFTNEDATKGYSNGHRPGPGGNATLQKLEHLNELIAKADTNASVATGYTVSEADIDGDGYPRFEGKVVDYTQVATVQCLGSASTVSLAGIQTAAPGFISILNPAGNTPEGVWPVDALPTSGTATILHPAAPTDGSPQAVTIEGWTN